MIPKVGVFTYDELLKDLGEPDTQLLKGSSWDRRRYQDHVDSRIRLRRSRQLCELGIDDVAFDLAIRLHEDPGLLTQVNAVLARHDLQDIVRNRADIADEERSVEHADRDDRLSRCTTCRVEAAIHIRGYHRLCDTCRAQTRQRTTSTNIGPALSTSRRHGLAATLTVDEWLTTIRKFNDRCAYCNEDWYVVEHVTPTGRGGGSILSNCLPACYRCNKIKGGRTLEEWLSDERLGDLATEKYFIPGPPQGKERVAWLEAALQWLTTNGRVVCDAPGDSATS